MLLRFTKMHGLGNDFVVVDAVSQWVSLTAAQVRKLADRHLGVGCDQVLVVEPPPSPDVDFGYRIYNADGSEVAQCGNGARCVAKYVRDRKLTGKSRIRVRTSCDILTLYAEKDGRYTVEMGAPILSPEAIPFQADTQATLYPLEVAGETLHIAAVSMGNPHAVLEVAEVATAPVATVGPLIESHPRFPQRANVGFMAVRSREEIDLRVYERGAGETLACGSGACAAVVAGILQNLLDSTVDVNLPGGTLRIRWRGDDRPVMMTGPAAIVFHGRIRV